MIKLKNSMGFSAVEALLILVIVGILGFTGWFVYHAQHAASKDYSAYPNTQVSTKKKSTTIAPTSESQRSSASSTPQTQTGTKPAVKTFNFVDTTGWQTHTSLDQAYSIQFGSDQSYGYCKSTSVVMVGMVYMDGRSNQYDCTGIKDALTQQDPSKLVLTYVAFGQSETLWDKGSASAVNVTLSSGQSASRYEYTNNIGGTVYDTIEYDTTHQSKSYMAVLHWPDGTNYSMQSDYFDTIVQKTWTFN